MGKGAKKATKKFVTSGQLKKTIQSRQKAMQIKKKIQGRRGHREGKGKERSITDDAEDQGGVLKGSNKYALPFE
jgi:nucleolar complex protein 2